MSEHARFSPSKMQRTMSCVGALALEEGSIDIPSKYAMEGTAAHQLLEWTLNSPGQYAYAFQGRIIKVTEGQGRHKLTLEFEADEEMCAYIQHVVDDVLARVDAYKKLPGVSNVTLYAEQRIDISGIINVPKQFGTADIIILVEFEDGKAQLFVGDLKYGKGVAVYAEGNEQMLTYAAGVVDLHSLTSDVTDVTMCIYMPRLDYIDTHDVSYREIITFGHEARAAVKEAEKQAAEYAKHKDPTKLTLTPGEKQCQFCKAKATCPALTSKALAVVMDEFDDLDEAEGKVARQVKASIAEIEEDEVPVERLAEYMQAAGIIEDWIKAVRARVEALLYDGKTVPGFKLVEGRRGHRRFKDAERVTELLKGMRFGDDDIFTKKLKSPKQVQNLLKGQERRWAKLAKYIEQPPGTPSVARIDDKRVAYLPQSVADEFDDLDAADNSYEDVC